MWIILYRAAYNDVFLSLKASAVCKEESDGSASESVADSHGHVSRECDEDVKQAENLPFHSLDSAAKVRAKTTGRPTPPMTMNLAFVRTAHCRSMLLQLRAYISCVTVQEEPVETTDAACQYDQPEADDSPSSESEESEPASPGKKLDTV